jgi:hypothetical protein
MKRPLALFLIISFILWILPLGVFIRSSLEKFACDGQRAICMCRALVPKSSGQAMEPGTALKAGASASKENPSGGANYFVSTKPTAVLDLHFASIFEDQHLCYKSPYLAALEYVPKV